MSNEPMILIPQRILFQLAASHSVLSEAEYNRNPRYNNEHFSAKAEFALMNEISKHDSVVYENLILAMDILRQDLLEDRNEN